MRIFFAQRQSVFENRQLTTADLTAEQLEMFFNVAFTHWKIKHNIHLEN